MRELGARKKRDFCLRFLGRKAAVLIEDRVDGATGWHRGFTRNYLPVVVGSEGNSVNREIEVEIECFQGGWLRGAALEATSAQIERHGQFASNAS
jgi:tRNA A37 methylthiotransferase MiaB